LSPPVLAAFVVKHAPKMAPRTRLGLCCHLRVLLRFCHREGITSRDLSGAVGTPQIYRLDDVPRSITWDEVRRMLEAVERRTIRGRRCATTARRGERHVDDGRIETALLFN
jgi:integrase